MKSFFILIFLFSFGLGNSYELNFPEPETQEEALFLRRIAAFWEEKEYDLVQMQIADFLEKYPNTAFSEPLLILQGDLALRKQDYPLAAACYEKIDPSHLSSETLLNKFETLLKLEWYHTLAEECMRTLQSRSFDTYTQNQLKFFLAEAFYHLTLRSPKDSESFHQYAQQAKKHLEEIQDPSLQTQTQKSLAYLYHILGETEKAETLYLSLAEKHPAEKEDYLFKVAEMQMQRDKEKALQTFTRISHLGKGKAAEANFHRLILLYDMNRYSEIILAKPQLESLFPEEKKPYLYLMLGKSHYLLEDYKRCIQELNYFFQLPSENKTETHEAFLTLLDAAKKTEDLPLFETISQEFEQKFPQDPSLAKTLWIRAILYKKHQKTPLAQKDFEKLLSLYPDFEERPSLLFEYAHLQFENKDWRKARGLFSQYLQESKDKTSAKAIPFLIQASLENVQAHPDLKSEQVNLIEDLEKALTFKDILSDSQEQSYLLLLAKTYFDIKNYPSCIETSLAFLEKEPPHQLAAQGHLLLAYSYQSQEDASSLFCEHIEKALELFPEHPEKQNLYLALFNTYLQRDLPDLASEKLYAYYTSGGIVLLENQLWLADYYYQKVKHSTGPSKEQEAPHRAIALYEGILQNYPSFFIQPGRSLELEILHLAQMYDVIQEYEKKRVILEHLCEKYQNSPEELWSKKSDVFFQLAYAYENLQQTEKALSLYQQVIEMAPTLQEESAALSAYHTANLFIQQANQSNHWEEERFHRTLQLLKDLSLQKNFHNEPIHLEAAILYVDLQSKGKEGENNPFARLFLLEKTLSNFTSKEDIPSKEYHTIRAKQPEKEGLFQAYIKLMEAEALFCEASISLIDKNTKEALQCHKEALTLLKSIYPYTPFLEERLEKNVNDWETLALTES